jgi:glycosyltransferase involved in cell wall biosynthesis
MYLIAISVPIYLNGDAKLVTTDWYRSLILLRDALGGEFGPIHVLAPTFSADDPSPDQALEKVEVKRDDITLVPSFPFRSRCREYWLRYRHQWLAQLRQLLPRAQVVHAGLCDVFRPIDLSAILEAHRQNKPCLFVQDTDIVAQVQQLAVGRGLAQVARARTYAYCYERLCRRGVSLANLSLLKGRAVMARYAAYARNAKEFHNTSYLTQEMPSELVIRARIHELQNTARPIRLVSCGRLVARKGVDHSIRIVGMIRELGGEVSLDIIGNGPDRTAIAELIRSLSLEGVVKLLGAAPYGPHLLRRLADYDAMLFTPLAEDTPRAIFDGYAAGLPLLAYDIAYVRERAGEEEATLLLPTGAVSVAATRILEVLRDREQLARLTFRAREAGQYHAAENWYRRRAEWTREAVGATRPRKTVSQI